MNDEIKFKLQAYLDGELSGGEAREVAEQLSKDNDARFLLSELQFIKSALRENEPELKLPESREFYWSKIRREIERGTREVPARAPLLSWWNPRLIGGLAAGCALLVVSFVAFNTGNNLNHAHLPGEVEASSEEMGAITYRSDAERMTVVYLFDRVAGEMVDSLTN